MALKNLPVIGRLQGHAADPGWIGKLLAAARRKLADARVHSISPDNASMRPTGA